jgi:hypothetical protein
MSMEQHDALAGSGINPDQVLHSTMKRVMLKFNQTYHPGDSVGYAYGIHHDTAHLHVHVAICPRTANGKYVGCSIAKKRQALAIESGSRLVSRLMRVPKPKVVRVVEKIATTIEQRSIRDMQKKLFQLKRQYRAEHKRYSRLFGFTAYSNRNAHIQQLAQAQSVGV